MLASTEWGEEITIELLWDAIEGVVTRAELRAAATSLTDVTCNFLAHNVLTALDDPTVALAQGSLTLGHPLLRCVKDLEG